MRILKKSLKILLILILLYVLYVTIALIPAVSATKNNRELYYKNQLNHIEDLEKLYSENYKSKNEQDFCDFDTSDENLKKIKFNELRVLATHNSYKLELNKASHFFFNYSAPFLGMANGPTAYNYSYESLTNQLNCGIRSLEMDAVKKMENGEPYFECLHHALLDNHSSAINFELGFKEIAMWSKNNPNHMPITIIIEPKKKDVFANTKSLEVSDIKKLEEMANRQFGNSLYSPKEMLNNNADFKELTKSNAYPTLDKLKGKVMILLHQSDVMTNYINSDKTMQTQNFFPLIEDKNILENNELTKYSCFALSNDPLKTDTLNTLTNDLNMIARTRINIYPNHKAENFEKGISSNAQILSGDFPPRTDLKPDDYVSYLKNKYTMILRAK